MREPWGEPARRVPRATLLAEIHPAVRRAEAQPRQRVDDDAQPILADERVIPRVRLVAVELAQECVAPRAAQHCFDFARERHDVARRPLRQRTGVHHQHAVFGNGERPLREPVEQVGAIRRFENRRERVVAMRVAMTGRNRQEVQVVIAKHGDGGIAKRDHFAQHGERIRTAIDEIAGQPQPVARRGEPDQRQEIAEFRMATLYVADRIKRHEWHPPSAATIASVQSSADCSNASRGSPCNSR